jgi:uncharacterized membrane protein
MNVEAVKATRLEMLLAGLLQYGTWLASAVIMAGLAVAWMKHDSTSMRMVTAGIACFLLLPVMRVLVMLIAFIRERDGRFILIAATVLMVIFAGVVLGLRMARMHG